MSRFAELNKLYTPWREEWVNQYRQHQMLPFQIAAAFKDFLGCPDGFSANDEDKPIPYVSAALATRTGDDFTIAANREPWKDIDIDPDGHFYFGLQCFLEQGPNTYPKQPFWFLLQSSFEGESFIVRVKRSGQEFELPASHPGEAAGPLCQHLFELLKQSFDVPAMLQKKPKGKIGFV